MSEHVIELDFFKYKSLFDHCDASCDVVRTKCINGEYHTLTDILSGDELQHELSQPWELQDKKLFVELNGTGCDCILEMIQEAIDQGHKFDDIAIDVMLTKDIKKRLFTKGLAIIFDRKNAKLPYTDSAATALKDQPKI